MSTTHGQPGLSSDQRSTIRSTILSTRHTLESELRRQLEKYGIHTDKKLSLDKLTHLSAEEVHTRRTLDAAIERELESTDGDLERSITNYVREATKTYLNRFVALKTIEVRGLVEEIITERPEYGNRSYMHHTVAEIAGELTNAPDDGYGAALDLAYQEIGAEIRMIFEESEHTAIDLDVQVREEVLDELDAIDTQTWESDEALGWVYQYFGEKEREEIDERVDGENYKIAGTDIATKTQLFTPRYIVEWMVDNSLGRMWLEMRGERTNIDDEENCFYLSPKDESLIDRDAKNVQEIKVLDPACGSGHMLFYTFDVLYEMYLEEAEVPEKYIPQKILQNNLYGIDIDPGAAQLAALALYVKAKSVEPDVDINQINITSADAVLVNGDKKQEVLEKTDTDLEKKVLEQVWENFDNIREWGSLVRIEEEIESIIEEEREEIRSLRKKGQARFTGDGEITTQSSFVSGSREESWDHLKNRLLSQVSVLAQEAIEHNDAIEEMFVSEVEKSVKLLDLFLEEYEVVVSNPPYLDSGKIDSNLKNYVKNNFIGTRDLYTAFIERCTELVGEDNYVTMVTPETFMFLSSFQDLREKLVSDFQLIEANHLSRYGFDQAKDSFTIPFVVRNQDPSDFRVSRFYRMTHNQDEYSRYEDKISGLTNITRTLRENGTHSDVYVIDQNSFKEIDGSTLVYWFGQEILSLFGQGQQLEDIVFTQSGIKSGNNTKFLRKYWEVEFDEIHNRYRPHIRSENSLEYNDQTTWLIDWKDNGEYIQQYGDEHNHQYFFGDIGRFDKECIAFKKISRKKFAARYVSPNHLVDNQMGSIYPIESSNLYLNGWLNSSLVQYIIDGLNPTGNVTQGDLLRVPYIQPTSRERVENLTEMAIKRASHKISLNEVALEFDPEKYLKSVSDDEKSLALYEENLAKCDIQILNNLIDECILDEYDLSENAKSEIYNNTPGTLAEYPVITNAGELNSSELTFRSQIPTKKLSDVEYKNLINKISGINDKSIPHISEMLEISPYTVAMMYDNHNLYSNDKREAAAGRLLSFYLGCVLGRWDFEGYEPTEDGIIPIGDFFDENLNRALRQCIEFTFDDPYNFESVIEEMLGQDMANWIQNDFFSGYHCKEYRRRGQRIPIYWHLESSGGAFNCFVYYHSIDNNTLPKIRGKYLDSQINELENELKNLNAQTSMDDPDKKLLSRKEKVQHDLNDIKEFRNTIDKMIDDGVTVDVEKGIWENIKEWDQYEVLQTGLPKLKSSYSR